MIKSTNMSNSRQNLLWFRELERDLITKAMQRADWVISKAAPLLGLSYKTLQYRLEKYGIAKPEEKAEKKAENADI